MKLPPSDKDKQKFNKAMKALQGGKPADAVKLFAKIRKSWGDDADIGYLEGLAYGKLGNMRAIINVSKRALKLQPDHFGALCNLANAQISFGEIEAALENYAKAIEIKADAPEVLDNYGRALSLLGRREEAIEQYEKSLAVDPHHAPTCCALGKELTEAGHPKKALEMFERGLFLDPKLAEAHIGMGIINSGIGGLEAAEYHFNEAIHIEHNNVSSYIGLANLMRYTGDYEKGLEYLKKVEMMAGDGVDISGLKVTLLEQKGDKQQAYEIIDELINKNLMSPNALTVFSKLCREHNRCDEVLEMIKSFLENPLLNTTDKQYLMYAAGDMLDKSARYDEAMNYYQQANESADIICDRETYIRYHNNIINCFNKDALKEMPRATTRSSRPIFVLGMPRSGTTLTEQILSTHNDVFGAGELSYIKEIENTIRGAARGASNEDYASRIYALLQKQLTTYAGTYLDKINKLNSKARFVVDKMPANFIQIGLISLLFPEARIIYCQRNPLDNCLSIYFQSFIWSHDYAVDLADIGFYYSEHDRLMEHWKQVIDIPIMTVQYEDILQDQEGMSRKLLDFCGLEWDESVLEFYKSDRNVGTASYDQVRRPIYKTSKERWRNYEKYVRPIYDELPEHIQKELNYPG